MSPRKDRVPVVFDTNVLIGYYLSRRKDSAGNKVYLLWRTRHQLQLIVSDEVVAEYLEILERLGVPVARTRSFKERVENRETVTRVKLGGHPTESRDPDDNLMLATASAGKAKFLITNDRDLLDIPAAGQQKLKFAIVTPAQFLARLEEKAMT